MNSALYTLSQDAAAYVERLAYEAGVHARLQGKPREIPAGAPASGHAAFLRGWDEATVKFATTVGEA